MDKKQIAHDIAVSILPKYLEETKDKVCIYDNDGKFNVNSRNIKKAYEDIYSSVLSELSVE